MSAVWSHGEGHKSQRPPGRGALSALTDRRTYGDHIWPAR
jgi:hypothetical protein